MTWSNITSLTAYLIICLGKHFIYSFYRRANIRIRPKKQYLSNVNELGCGLLSDSDSSEGEKSEITPCVPCDVNDAILLQVCWLLLDYSFIFRIVFKKFCSFFLWLNDMVTLFFLYERFSVGRVVLCLNNTQFLSKTI